MNMQEKVLGWIGKDSPLVADNIIPPVAMMPEAKPEAKPMTDEDKRLLAAIVAARAPDRAEIERLTLELGHALKDLMNERIKSGLLELDIAQMANDKQTLQTELNEKNGFLNTVKDINDKTTAAFARLDIKGAAKKARTPRPKKKTERESTAETAKTAGET